MADDAKPEKNWLERQLRLATEEIDRWPEWAQREFEIMRERQMQGKDPWTYD